MYILILSLTNTLFNKSLIPSPTKLQYPIEEKFKDNKYNKNKYKYKNNNKRYGDRNNKSSNFEQRDYSDFDFNKFYVNVN